MIPYIKQVAAVAAVAATGGSTAVDLSDFIGRGRLVLMHTAANATETVDVKVQHRETDSDAWGDLDGAAFAQITDAAGGTKEIEIEADRFKKQVRLHFTVSAGGSATIGAVFVGKQQYGRA